MEFGVPTAQQLAEFFLAAQHPLTRRWVDDGARLALLAEQRSDDVLLATDVTVAASRARRFAPRQPAQALLNYWVAAAADLHAMMSIRYQGLDPAKPFVDATVLSRPFTADDMAALAQAAAKTYGTLQPRYLRLWSAAPASRFADTIPDKRFLAAPVTALRAGAGQPVPTGLGLAPASSLEHYTHARAAYDAMATKHPGHPEQAGIADLEDLQDNLANGTLFDVTIDDRWAGYLAVSTNGESLGMPAYIVEELVLATPFRGRGYGPYLTTLLARALPDATRILVGTIHANNQGARHAAERAGRRDIGGWIQLPLQRSQDSAESTPDHTDQR
ncbi:hypothetical protein Rhe02_69470 [Rhizocola hellebori]|uniref:N-acetyltransferase domain-containing protein n=1 Tax=Rhizocola hellebori TaxID=1392758 RepID=A0A8J3QDQ2_9ACTN|nr:GNAT family N-acetyltransferase [Rhizocola hellebori]GIH08880.1 hypothetical protein Rhe02_69470 [Rhizocola hellebori]